MISNKKKALVHIAKAKTGMTDQEYRDLLAGAGAASSKDLDEKGFSRVMDQFERLGFRTTSKTRKKPRRAASAAQGRRSLMRKLEAILLDLDLPWAYVDGIAKKRFGVDAVQWLDQADLYKLVQMMCVYQKRKRRA